MQELELNCRGGAYARGGGIFAGFYGTCHSSRVLMRLETLASEGCKEWLLGLGLVKVQNKRAPLILLPRQPLNNYGHMLSW